MVTTLVYAAVKQNQLPELGRMISGDSEHKVLPASVHILAPAYEKLLLQLEDRIICAILYHHVVDHLGVEFHSIGLLDIDDVTHIVHNRPPITGLLMSTPHVEQFAEMQEKAKRLDQIVAAAGKHALRLFPADMGDSFDTLGELYNWLDNDLNKGKSS